MTKEASSNASAGKLGSTGGDASSGGEFGIETEMLCVPILKTTSAPSARRAKRRKDILRILIIENRIKRM